MKNESFPHRVWHASVADCRSLSRVCHVGVVALVFAFAFGLAGCGKKTGHGGNNAPEPLEIVLSGGIKLVMQPIPAGKFMMGSPVGEAGRGEYETQHRVTISRPFWMGKTEVTQAQWKAVMGTEPSHIKGANLPVENVTWDEAVAFCRKLTALERRARRLPEGYAYTLPTEAQWEYACRAGTTTTFHFGNELNGTQANCNGEHPYGTATQGPYLFRTTDVGSYAPNAWGLYDMHGNVWEWCWNRFEDYPKGAQTDPVGPVFGRFCVLRGGGYHSPAKSCRAAERDAYGQDQRRLNLGFRLALCSE